jgi:ribonuclease E
MTKRMLIDATHAEETRVVVLDGSRLEDFDVETSTKKQLKGNIYLAKVVRVEPSLQAAFVEYGGNRHGFLAFGEIHPDYYQIPVADRQRLLELEAEEARREEEEDDRAAERLAAGEAVPAAEADAEGEPLEITPLEERPEPAQPLFMATESLSEPEPAAVAEEPQPAPEPDAPVAEAAAEPEPAAEEPAAFAETDLQPPVDIDHASAEDAEHETEAEPGEVIVEAPPPETVGGEHEAEDVRERRIPSRFLRNYKIQEVIRRRQILLVQVVKEERGTKGAALTTYVSLAGRYCVLMPNSPRGGGISRKITAPADRRRLKELMAELEIAQGMGLIVRTAGANRPKAEIKRDCEYLLRLWDDIREHTLKSVAPALIYEEASLIKRAIRDVYSRDIDEIQVDGEEGWRAAHEFMRMLMPTHARKVQLWRDAAADGGGQPLFAKYQVEAQLDAMLLPTAQLRSGGYLVINQAEALVAIDVNSGRSTRERSVEDTALRTNLEAAEELSRQLRLRDLAGLIVIDFIDMESKKHNAMVERKLKDALKNDRARIQVGHISHFGLLEMSRQRLRPSLAETSFIPCPHCGGMGHVRSTESAAIHVLRGIEEEGAKRRAAEIVVHVWTPVALYILNHKRERLREIELRYGMRVICLGDDAQVAPQFRIDRVKARTAETVVAVTPDVPRPIAAVQEEVAAEEFEEAADTEAETAEAEEGEHPGGADPRGQVRRRRRRRRRGGGRRDEHETETQPAAEAAPREEEAAPEQAAAGDRPRRPRRGRHRPHQAELPPHAAPDAEQPELPPVYQGPTPANPFGGHTFDIFDVLEQAEAKPEPVREPEPAREPELVAAPEPALLAIEPLEPEPAPMQAVEEPPVAANDEAAEPAVKPIVIGSAEDVVTEKKRGWWRR